MITNEYLSIPRSAISREYRLDGGPNDTNDGTKVNATATNVTYETSSVGSQKQCLVWGASSSFTYTTFSYTDSYIWIKSSGVWSFVKNSNKVSATALSGTSGERYAGLVFTNRTLTAGEENLLYYEGLRQTGGGSHFGPKGLLDGCVAYYDMNGDTNDIVGGNNGTVSGASLTTDHLGITNRAYSFTANTQYIGLPNAVSNTTTLGMGYYVKFSSFADTLGSHIFGDRNSNGSNELRISVKSTGMAFLGYWSSSQQFNISYIGSLGTSNYHFIYVEYGSGYANLYLDGVLVGTDSSVGARPADTLNPRIGHFFGTSDYQFYGNIDSAIFFNRKLSADEIKSLNDIYSKRYLLNNGVYLPPELKNGLKIWATGDSSGNTYYDSSGNGNNGTGTSYSTKRNLEFKAMDGTTSSSRIAFPVMDYNNVSFNIWVKPIAGAGGIRYLLAMDNPSLTYGIAAFAILANNTYYMQLRNASWSGVVPATIGKWTMLTMTKSGTTNKYYVNGALMSTVTSSANSNSGNGDSAINIGNERGSPYAYYANSQMANFMAWDRTLSGDDIQELFYSTKLSIL